MDSFEFEYGRVLENVEVAYATYGMPKYDDDGYITNFLKFQNPQYARQSTTSNSEQHRETCCSSNFRITLFDADHLLVVIVPHHFQRFD